MSYEFQESPRGVVVFASRSFTEYRTPTGDVVTVRHRPKPRNRRDREWRRRRMETAGRR